MCRTLRQITAALERDTAAAGKNVNYGGALFDYDLVADSPDRALSMMMALVSDAADVLLATDHANPDAASPASPTKTCSSRITLSDPSRARSSHSRHRPSAPSVSGRSGVSAQHRSAASCPAVRTARRSMTATHGRDDAGWRPWLQTTKSSNSAVAWMIQHEDELQSVQQRLHPEPDAWLGRAAGQYCLELGTRSSQDSSHSGSAGAPSTTSSVSLTDSRRSAS